MHDAAQPAATTREIMGNNVTPSGCASSMITALPETLLDGTWDAERVLHERLGIP
jgi:hypothetical protein